MSLPPIERPKTMGSQVASRGQAEVAVPGQGGRSREREQKQRSGRSEVGLITDLKMSHFNCVTIETFKNMN